MRGRKAGCPAPAVMRRTRRPAINQGWAMSAVAGQRLTVAEIEELVRAFADEAVAPRCAAAPRARRGLLG